MASDYPRLDVGFRYRSRRFKDAARGLEAFAGDLGASINRQGPVLSQEMRVFLDGVAEALARRHSGPWPAGTSEGGVNQYTTLSKRSGKMLTSIRSSVKVTKNKNIEKIQGRIGGNFYAKVQEEGAVITPKTAQWLTVPLPAALTPRGIPKKRSAREWDNTFVSRSRKGNLIIFRRVGTTITPLYVLKRRVEIPPRLGMQQSLEVGLPAFVDRAIDNMLRAVLHDVG